MAKPTLYTQEMLDRYSKDEYLGKVTISDIWEKNAREFPHREAVVDSRNRLTWGQAKQWIDRMALSFLGLGLQKDDVVVLQLPNCVELLLMRVACERAGLLQLPALRTLRHTEMLHILKQSEAKALAIPWKYRDFDYYDMVQELKVDLPFLKHVIVWGEEVPQGAVSLKKFIDTPLEKNYPSDFLESTKISALEVSLICLTTGTTGLPKFVEWPNCSLVVNKVLIKNLRLTENDILGGMTGAVVGPNVPAFYTAIQVPARIVLMEHWSVEEGLKLIQKEKITVPCVVPTQLAEMLAFPRLEDYDLSSIRVIKSSGALLPYPLALEAEKRFKCKIHNGYGSADISHICTNSIDEPQEVRLLTVGKPFPGTKVQLRDPSGNVVATGAVGEIFVRGEFETSGYFKDPEMTKRMYTEDGWIRTGDLGKMDEEGNLTIVGREKDMIIRGGQNIYPIEVVNLLLTHAKVADAAIVGVPDPLMGERACACIVLKTGQSINLEEVVSFLKGKRIAAYKIPERLLLLDSLPYVSGLKLDRKKLQAIAIERLK